MSFGVDDLRFTTSYWYGDTDLVALESQYGLEFMEKIYFHIMAFEAHKLTSLRPSTFDLGPFVRFYTKEFEELWRTVFRNSWAEWRYENDLPDYFGPVALSDPSESSSPGVTIEYGPVHMLTFCGGGKDSLVAIKLLERAGIAYSAFIYSSSIYGTAGLQHELIHRLLDYGSPVKRHQLWIYDDFMDSPILDLYPQYGVKGLLASEITSSIFGVLPLVLQHGYRYITLANERSADIGNLIWEKTGEDVNHQWTKSLAAELLINRYLQSELIANSSYFSILKPVYDVLIFNLLRRDLECVPHTHSCNIRKPWCGRCPKCAYVWVSYMAYLPVDLVNSIFKQNLFNVPENCGWFRQMLGLEDQTPFECIGQVPETRLAFELCRRKGLTGKAMDVFTAEVPAVEINSILDKYLSVDSAVSTIPPEIAAKVLRQMRDGANEARLQILGRRSA